MQWLEFEERLTDVLLGASERTYLILSVERPEIMWRVQFIIDPDVLTSECNTEDLFRSVGGASDEVQQQLGRAGWAPPVSRHSAPFWKQQLQVPALSSEYGATARNAVTTLRDLFRIASPDELTYTAWREEEWPIPGKFYTGDVLEALDSGQNPLELELGIRMLQTK